MQCKTFNPTREKKSTRGQILKVMQLRKKTTDLATVHRSVTLIFFCIKCKKLTWELFDSEQWLKFYLFFQKT